MTRYHGKTGRVNFGLNPCIFLLLLVQAEGGGRRDDALQAPEELSTVEHRWILHDEADDAARDTCCPCVG